MLTPAYVKFAGLIIYVLTAINLANSMVVYKDLVISGVGDGIIINYSGTDYIYVLTSDLSDVFIVDVLSTSASGQYSGAVYMKLAKHAINIDDSSFLVVLYSTSPYVINISKVSSNNVQVETLRCPGNVSLQLMFRLINNLTGNYGPQPVQIPQYLKAPLWNVVIVTLLLLMFAATALLDVRDYSQIKKDRWGVGESIALVVRYLVYGSLIAFLCAALITIGLTIYNNFMYRSSSFDISWLFIPFLILVVNLIAYYICKWRGLYDVIDEE
ncbi:MAG: hypothetical protein QXT01_02805 [Sulfolobales archaeon]